MRPSKKTLIVEWVHLKAQIERLEKKKSEVEEKFKVVLEKEPEWTLEIDGWKCTLVEATRRNFSISKAEEKLSPQKFSALEEFISKSTSRYIKTTWQGGSEPSV